MSNAPHVKLEMRVGSDNEVHVETPWAIPVTTNQYKLDNCPFYAYRVSWGDIVEALPQEDGGFPLFVRVVQKSGHRTVRVILDRPSDKSEDSQRVLDTLNKMGCTYERANPTYIVVDIPPEVELQAVAEYLTNTGHNWEYADPKYEDLFPDEQSRDRLAV
ncbi:MAG: DUF4265 domain-containing protein [Planctomycetia bacterium]|nr:DUF4265 domain-containing protein [Planctomycetia bacterium]